MAIQQIDLGSAPSGTGGDTQRVANTKINENFSNPDHAASRMIGTGAGQIPLARDAIEGASKEIPLLAAGGDFNNLTDGKFGVVFQDSNVNVPSNTRPDGKADGWYFHSAKRTGASYFLQRAWGYFSGDAFTRIKGESWSEWKPSSQHTLNYTTTTATAPNVFVDTNGMLKRSTSSEKYKDIIASLELDDEAYQKALNVKPIVYRSKADSDPDNWHFMSFSAEELGAYDPCLTQWKTHDIDPETGEQVELEQKEAEGINLNAICAVLHATNIKQAELIDDLAKRVAALEAK